jgi:hypothetical protein
VLEAAAPQEVHDASYLSGCCWAYFGSAPHAVLDQVSAWNASTGSYSIIMHATRVVTAPG